MSDLENDFQRPDLTGIAPEIVAYIENLEMALAVAREAAQPAGGRTSAAEPSEPETTIQVIAISAAGVGKRTPRHFYGRQRRGGMGVFDLDSDEDDPPAFLVLADLDDRLLLFTDLGRVFPVDVAAVPETEVRGRGASLLEGLNLRPGERLVAVLPGSGGRQVALASERGWVRTVGSAFLGRTLIPGLAFHDPTDGGRLAAACWSNGDADLFVATRAGEAIRFAESLIPGRRGRLALRPSPGDTVVGIAPTAERGGVLLLGADGKGTIRLMDSFRQTKTSGSGTKQAFKTDRLVGVAAVTAADDVFVISQLGKIIRFSAAEIPAKSGNVQGVNCMALRADECAALAVCAVESAS